MYVVYKNGYYWNGSYFTDLSDAKTYMRLDSARRDAERLGGEVYILRDGIPRQLPHN